MSFQTGGKHSSSFVVGAESGMLFRCNMRQSRTRVTPPADAAELWSPEAWALLSRARSADREGTRVILLFFLATTSGRLFSILFMYVVRS